MRYFLLANLAHPTWWEGLGMRKFSSHSKQQLWEAFEQSEAQKTCLVASSRPQYRQLLRLLKHGEVLMPLSSLFVREAYWQNLNPLERHLHLLRGLSTLHPSWVFYGVSAAAVHGLWVSYGLLDRIHMASRNVSHGHDSECYARHHLSSREQITKIDGVRVTTLDWTVFDCMRMLSFSEGLPIADSWLRRSGQTREALLNLVRSLGAFKGAKQARITASLADGRSENGGESIARAAIIELGYRIPELQVRKIDPLEPNHCFYLDFYWVRNDGSEVAGELDGKQKYESEKYLEGRTPEGKRQEERQRESRLNLSGLTVVRFSFRDVIQQTRLDKILDAYRVPWADRPIRTAP